MRKTERVQSRIGRLLLGSAFALGLLTPSFSVAQSVTVTLPLYGQVDAVIDWGSAHANATCDRVIKTPGPVSCTYDDALDSAPPFRVRVSGTVTQFGNGEAGYPNADRVLRVVRFGSVGLTSLSGAFKGAERLTEVASDFPVTVTDISHIFSGAVQLDDPKVSAWGMRVANVVNMTGAFENALEFSQPIDGWCMRHVAAPPQRFREKTAGPQEILNKSQRIGRPLPSEMRLTPEKEPKWGQCGVTLALEGETPAQPNAPFSLNLRDRISFWDTAPDGVNLSSLRFRVVDGALPPGLTLDEVTGLIEGVPTQPGSFTFRIRAEHI